MHHLDHEAITHTDLPRLITQAFGIADDVLAEHGVQSAAADLYDRESFRMEVDEHIAETGSVPSALDLGQWLADECLFAATMTPKGS